MLAFHRRLVLALLVAALTACGGDSSTTSSVDTALITVEETLVPVGRDACHVLGTVLNTSDAFTFKVTLRWQAFDAADKALGTTAVELDDLRPGERRAYDATGFASNDQGLIPCSRIVRFERIETTVTRA